tara:strand:+ start:1151 stop:1774 length:624 start_codon:yes stop_codon:yes gene_type:complete
MSKFYSLIPFFFIFLISSCDVKTTSKSYSKLKINNFKLNQFSNNGEQLYSITSPISTINQRQQIYNLDKTIINFFDNNKLKYTINSDTSTLFNDEKKIILEGNIRIIDNAEDKTIINAEKFIWDINKSKFQLNGNVSLNNKFINLKSSKASLNKKTNIIEFSNPVSYKYKDNNNEEYNISSENAYYNLKNNKVIFNSSKRVKTKFVY